MNKSNYCILYTESSPFPSAWTTIAQNKNVALTTFRLNKGYFPCVLTVVKLPKKPLAYLNA